MYGKLIAIYVCLVIGGVCSLSNIESLKKNWTPNNFGSKLSLLNRNKEHTSYVEELFEKEQVPSTLISSIAPLTVALLSSMLFVSTVSAITGDAISLSEHVSSFADTAVNSLNDFPQQTIITPSDILPLPSTDTNPAAITVAFGESNIAATTATILRPVDVNWRYFLSGAVCCSFSHGVSVPFDVLKTRIQTRPKDSKKDGILSTAINIVETEGVGALLQGMGPTLIGFAVQGSLKYGFYDVFKQVVSNELYVLNWHWEKLFVFMLAGAAAELIGTTSLSPFETARIRLVSSSAANAYALSAPSTTTTTTNNNPINNEDNGLLSVWKRIWIEEGPYGLFKGLPAMMLKGLPYTVVQLSVFEFLTTAIYSAISDAGYSRAEAVQFQFVITLFTALVAAFFSTIVSQPGDTLFTALTKSKSNSKPIYESKSTSIASELIPTIIDSNEFDSNINVNTSKTVDLKLWEVLQSIVDKDGLAGLFVGMQARLLHVSFFVSVQLVVYDYVKQLCGIPATGLH
mmetsp:Transcript_12382/g.17015  ORF Transcript_12382/g.17015 Transcript_12382/m.17015 type:complete len:515 (+) Transcript_12382:48-1592(+)